MRPACYLLLATVLLLGGAAPAPTGLRSPWDTPPQAAATAESESCAHPLDLPAGITASDYYSDATLPDSANDVLISIH